jgi:branched-chain amino acid transport system substrate-binding protein
MQKTRMRRTGVALAGLALVLAACGSDKKESSTTSPAASTTAAAASTTAAGGESSTTAGSTPATGDKIAPIPTGVKCSNLSLAFLGALSGDNGNLGKNMINGAQIAFDEFNKANPDCQVKFDTSYDSQGDPAQATPLADTIVSKADIIGLIGPGFSGETKATMPKFEAAGMPIVSPSATNAQLSTQGWKMFHRVLANDDKQAPGIANLIKNVIKGTKVGVVDDAAESVSYKPMTLPTTSRV